jgi:hypothetical protein
MANLKREWTPEDDEVIRRYAPKVSLQRLSVRLKRSSGSIKCRADQLGVPTISRKRLRQSALGTSANRISINIIPHGIATAQRNASSEG